MQLVPLDLQFIVAIVTFHVSHASNSSSTAPVLSLGVDFPQFFSIFHLLLALGLPFMLCFKESFFSCSCKFCQQYSTITCDLTILGLWWEMYTLFSLIVSLTKALCPWASGSCLSGFLPLSEGAVLSPFQILAPSPKGEFVLFSCFFPRCRGRLSHCSK